MTSEQIREILEAATPGPWTFDRTDDPWRGSIDGASGTDRSWGMLAKVVVRMEGDVGDLPEGIANARLIAAAPDLAAEVLRLREQASRESAIADDIEPLSSQQAAKYTDLIARLSVQKASEQEAIKAIKDLCHDNERLAVLLQKRKAEMTDLRAKMTEGGG
jgi:hypothetical protein